MYCHSRKQGHTETVLTYRHLKVEKTSLSHDTQTNDLESVDFKLCCMFIYFLFQLLLIYFLMGVLEIHCKIRFNTACTSGWREFMYLKSNSDKILFYFEVQMKISHLDST